MFTYAFRERVITFVAGGPPSFPNDIVIHADFEPQVPFGGVAGPSRTALLDQDFKARANLQTGRFTIHRSAPLFDPVQAEYLDSGVEFKMEGAKATLVLANASQDAFESLIGLLYSSFPVFLNVFMPERPYAHLACGTVGAAQFVFLFQPNELQGSVTILNKEIQEERIAVSWRRTLQFAAHNRLLNGLHYFHVAVRLTDAGFNRFEFMSESIHNFAKALQAVFGETRDSVRGELVKLGYTPEEVERNFIPYLVLRNEFDVSHVSLATFSLDQFKTLHAYSDQAEGVFRSLFQRLLERLENGTYSPIPESDGILSRDRKKAMEKLAAHLKPKP
jgi:hypothetical protein